jgi:hypothetical protein
MDGPLSSDVEKIAKQYEAGRFDGMIDYAWNVTHWLLPDGSTIVAHSEGTEDQRSYAPAINNAMPCPDAKLVMFGARYVFCNRKISKELKALALHQTKQRWGISEPVTIEPCSYNPLEGTLSKDFYVENADNWLATLVHRELQTIGA